MLSSFRAPRVHFEKRPLAKKIHADPFYFPRFVALLGVICAITAWECSQGPRGYDYDGNICGVDLPFSEYIDQKVCPASCLTSPSTSLLAFKTPMDYISDTTEYVSRFCLVALEAVVTNAANAVSKTDVLQHWIRDIEGTLVIAISIAVAFLIGFVYMVFLRYCSGMLIWFAISAFIGNTFILGWRFYEYAKELELADTSNSSTSQTILMNRIIAYICSGVASFAFLTALCLFNRIRLAIVIMKAAADYVNEIFLIRPVTAIILLTLYAFGSLILAIIQLVRFVLASIQVKISIIFRPYLLSKKLKDIRNKFFQSAFACLLSHLLYFEKCLVYIQSAFACLLSYLLYFEKCLKLLNEKVYPQIILLGQSFWGATKDAFHFILHKPIRLGVVSSIEDFFMFLGKIFIATITSLIAFIVLTHWDRYSSQIYSPFAPTVIVFIFAYAAGAVFMTVYGLAADIALACLTTNEQINKQNHHLTPSLRKLIDKHGKNKI